MKKFQFNAIASLLCAGAVASGAFVTNVAAADTTREQRMEQALQSYRGAPANNNASTNDASRRGYRDVLLPP